LGTVDAIGAVACTVGAVSTGCAVDAVGAVVVVSTGCAVDAIGAVIAVSAVDASN
jgi:hypothetical protein